ncbi:MAG: rhomboid family intramembrane serine protease [Thiotrichales bacterium]|nr:rhomboid family intramembrane serine protease [Thiotrichales bacterium]
MIQIFGHKINVLSLYLFGAMWAVYLVDFVIPGSLTQFGIQPRSMSGLTGIIFSPFLHAGLGHIISNSIPLVVLGILVQLHSKDYFIKITLLGILLSGAFTWVFSSAGVVVGASGLIFCYWSFLLAYGFFRKDLKSIIIALVVAVCYFGLIFGLVSLRSHISFAGHFGGFLSGVLLAYWLKKDVNSK